MDLATRILGKTTQELTLMSVQEIRGVLARLKGPTYKYTPPKKAAIDAMIVAARALITVE